MGEEHVNPKNLMIVHHDDYFVIIIIPDWLHKIKIHLFPRIQGPFCNFHSSDFINAINNCTCTSVWVFSWSFWWSHRRWRSNNCQLSCHLVRGWGLCNKLGQQNSRFTLYIPFAFISHKITGLLNMNLKQRSLDVHSSDKHWTDLLEESHDYQKLFQNPSLESIHSGKASNEDKAGRWTENEFYRFLSQFSSQKLLLCCLALQTLTYNTLPRTFSKGQLNDWHCEAITPLNDSFSFIFIYCIYL